MDDLSREDDLCPSQTNAPNASWGVDELGRYARDQNRAISTAEQKLTPYYWQLGHALELAKRQFNRKQWAKYLGELAIDPTRASKGRAIHRTFPSITDLGDLSVKQAYERRVRTPGRRRPQTASRGSQQSVADGSTGMMSFFVDVGRRAESVIADVEFAAPADAANYLSALEAAIEELGKLRDALRRKASES